MRGLEPPEPTRLGELLWLEPFPDVLLEGLADHAPGPEARYETRESISLAFITALQLLPPRQRAAIILRDVLGFHASEAARILDTTSESVTSALKRARAARLERHQALARRRTSPRRCPTRPANSSSWAWCSPGRSRQPTWHGIVALLTEDVWLTMPPLPLEYQGRELAPSPRGLRPSGLAGPPG